MASLCNDSIAQAGAQKMTFGEIACRELMVIDEEGTIALNWAMMRMMAV